MRFWDSSATVPLLVEERQSGRLIELLEEDAQAVIWWATPVECASAIARRERDGALALDAGTAAIARMRVLERAWAEVSPSQAVRTTAQRVLRVHSLRAADSLQLAAALVAAAQEPSTLPFVCLDERLADAARREGFPVIA